MTIRTMHKAKPGKLFIGGQWLDPQSGKTFPVINPATEEIVTTLKPDHLFFKDFQIEKETYIETKTIILWI